MDMEFSGFPSIGTSVEIYEAGNNTKRLRLSMFSQIKLTKDTIPQYIANEPKLKHVRIGDNMQSFVYVDEKNNNRPICTLAIETKLNGEKWIQALEVFKGFKRRGLGKELLEYATNHLGARFLSVNKDNEIALKMYRLHGFKPYASKGSMYFMRKDK